MTLNVDQFGRVSWRGKPLRIQPMVIDGQPSLDPTSTLITARGKTHGDFHDHASCTQNLKYAMQGFVRRGDDRPAYDALNVIQKESLEMIVHKIGRILAGDPGFRDHWDDIAGYARLVAERCSK